MIKSEDLVTITPLDSLFRVLHIAPRDGRVTHTEQALIEELGQHIIPLVERDEPLSNHMNVRNAAFVMADYCEYIESLEDPSFVIFEHLLRDAPEAAIELYQLYKQRLKTPQQGESREVLIRMFQYLASFLSEQNPVPTNQI
jgi:hypothetical protein